ncbi:acyltransferase [Sinorhizobium sp. BG8]|uniref:acyltransferase family protein n=1 Tax=Sinorhizobium sp. BG8 TaxID=2613773 RepID=UPI00193DC6BD|nr:acyltransferase [Sinorhizobium sp. BG8]
MLQKADGRPSGFDYLRISLAIAITVFHSVRITHGAEIDMALWESHLRAPLRALLPMFFVLSGFLVAGSLVRCRTLISFLGLRVMRIYPALIGEVLLSALIIGPLLTELPLSAYFTDYQFFRYLANVTGHISFWLPGVFENNPDPGIVNAQLWTVPYELYCYLLLSALAVFGLKRHRWIGLAALIALMVAYWVFREFKPDPKAGLTNISGWMLIFYFLGGVSAYQFRDVIPANPLLLVASVVLTGIFLHAGPTGEYFAVIPVTYVTVYIGLIDFGRTVFSRLSDLSYGLYLYHWTLQQWFVDVFPGAQSAWLTSVAGLVGGLLTAWFSWVLIERPALLSKRLIIRVEDYALSILRRLRELASPIYPRLSSQGAER